MRWQRCKGTLHRRHRCRAREKRDEAGERRTADDSGVAPRLATALHDAGVARFAPLAPEDSWVRFSLLCEALFAVFHTACSAMPSIYQAKCRECGKSPPKYSLGEVIKEQLLISDQGVAFDDPKEGILFVSHPGEERSLRAMGAHPLNADGRVLAWQALVCSDCGAVSEQFRVGQRQAGCIPSIILAVIVGWLSAKYYGIAAACIAGFAVGFVALSCRRWFHQRKWHRRNESLSLKACPACTSQALIGVDEIQSSSMPCAHCHQESMIFEYWGIS